MRAEFQPPAGERPETGIEQVPACPVCGGEDRSLAFDGLRDRIFFCAPGTWTMMRCADCRSTYLDPRPTPQTIGLAYEDYYTHDVVTAADTASLSTAARLRRRLANGYRNWRFGAGLRPASRLGVPMALAIPKLRRMIDHQYRHLPKGKKGRVLDVGFGSGKFIQDAISVGWTAVGTDIDPKVIASARARGLDVVEGTADEVEGTFDHITLSHTIEHFHEPYRVLQRCHELLAPGGTIWIETPNAGALGLGRFGPDWRGLEPPRHLVLFTRSSLADALSRIGFTDVRDYEQPGGIVHALYAMSENIRRRQQPIGPLDMTNELSRAIAADTKAENADPAVREFIGLIARKAA